MHTAAIDHTPLPIKKNDRTKCDFVVVLLINRQVQA
jgi:hypothetical protein